MIIIGKFQQLKVEKFQQKGALLTNGEEEFALLPREEVPADVELGQVLKVFVYSKKEDLYLVTTKHPTLSVGDIGMLRIKTMTRDGAMLSWGLKEDLFLPSDEIKRSLDVGEQVAVMLIKVDEKLIATMKISNYLSNEAPYEVKDDVKGTVYDFNPEMGAFIAIDNRFDAMMQKKEIFEKVHVGMTFEGRVLKVREDGKLYVTNRKMSYLAKDDDSKAIIEYLKEHKGFMPYNDNSDPDAIKRVFKISKRAFKRALGTLYKAKVIKIEDEGVYLLEEEND